MAVEMFRRCIMQKPGRDGIRRTQCAVVRNTGNQLRTTCLATISQIFGPLARWKPSTAEVIFEFDDVYSNWILLPLDTPANIQRLLSLELTYAWVSEFREIRPSIVKDLYSRTGRYPSKINGGPDSYGLIMETNSFSEDSEWFDVLEVNLPGNWGYYVQPPGYELVTTSDDPQEEPVMVATGENAENLPETYYSDQVESNGGHDSNWVRQYLRNEIAPSVAGEAVFRENFDYDFHVSERPLYPVPQSPLCVGLDTGRSPAAVVTQMSPEGQVQVLAEAYGSNMGMEVFVATYLRPLLCQERFVGLPVYLVIDPAGKAKGEVGEESVLMALKRLGFQAYLASTNSIAPRLRVVDMWLQQTTRGKPAIIFDGNECPMLCLSMASRYRYKRHRDGTLDEVTPEKLHPYSDCVDSIQYALLGSSERVRAAAVRRINQPTHPVKADLPTGAWT